MREAEKKKRPSNEKGDSRSRDLEFHSIGDYFAMIRERWFLGLFCAIVVSVLVGYLLMNRPAVYQAQAAIMIDHGERILDIPQVVESGLDGTGGWRIVLENHINQISSRNFRSFVAASFTEEEARTIIAPYIPEDDSLPAPSVYGAMGAIEVYNVPNSFMLQIRVRHRDPEAAALVADRYSERYIEYSRERRDIGNEDAIRVLNERAEEFGRRVNEAEEALQAYRREHNLVSVEENQNIVAQRLNNINANLMDARLARLGLEGQMRQVQNFDEDSGNLLELGEVISSATIRNLVNRLDELRREREIMSERYLERHPDMTDNERAISVTRELIRENVELAIADLRHRLENAREREQTLLTELEEAERESLNLDQLRIEYTGLQRAAEGARQSHMQILERLNQVTITSQLQNSSIRVFETASVPGSPVDPNLKRAAMLAIFLGGFFFVGAPIGLGVLDHKLKASMDVEAFLGQKLVGEIPYVRRIKDKERAHVVEKDLDDQVMESFRGIVSQLQLQWEGAYPKALMATSTIPGEGKSFLVSNLGYSFAAHGKKTLLVDFDLRRPALHRIYGFQNDAGILRWLNEGGLVANDPLDDEALGIAEVAPNLFVLRAGGFTKNATESITHPAILRLISALKKKFDLLLLDTPPLGVFPDALTLARLADNAIYIVRFGRVDRRQVKNYIARLKETDSKVVGMVMNSMPKGRRFSHYYSGYGYGKYKYEKYYSGRT